MFSFYYLYIYIFIRSGSLLVAYRRDLFTSYFKIDSFLFFLHARLLFLSSFPCYTHSILLAFASAQEVPHEHLFSDGVSRNGQQPLSPSHVDPSDPSLHVTPIHEVRTGAVVGSIVGLDVGDGVSGSGSGSGCC